MEDTATGLHPVMERALAPFAPKPRYWFDITYSDDAGRRSKTTRLYESAAEAMEKNMAPGRCAIVVHKLTPAEVEAHLDFLRLIGPADRSAERREAQAERYSEPRGEYDNWTVGVRNRGY